eukprot:s1891_g15.t1
MLDSSNLRSLTFGKDFNQSLERLTLPSNLQNLTFGWHFNQSLERVTLPSNLRCLTFGYAFNQSLERVTLPSNLQSLTFGHSFNQSLERDFVVWTGVKERPEWIHGLLMYLAVKGLGRSKHLTMQLPKQCQQSDAAVSRLLDNHPNVVPSFTILTEETSDLVASISELHESFVFGQFMQAENTPLSLQILRQRAAEQDEAAYKLFLFSALGMLAGIGATAGDSGVGASTSTEK